MKKGEGDGDGKQEKGEGRGDQGVICACVEMTVKSLICTISMLITIKIKYIKYKKKYLI